MDISKKIVNADYAHFKGWLGKGVGIAFLDTGISPVDDFTLPENRITAFKDFVSGRKTPYDNNGHGTHEARPFFLRLPALCLTFSNSSFSIIASWQFSSLIQASLGTVFILGDL